MKNIFIRDDKKVLKGIRKFRNASNLNNFAKKGKIEKRGVKLFKLSKTGQFKLKIKNKDIQSINFTKTTSITGNEN